MKVDKVIKSSLFLIGIGFFTLGSLLEAETPTPSSPQKIEDTLQNRRPDTTILREIDAALRSGEQRRIGALLKENLGKTVTIEQIKKVAKKYKVQSLLCALEATAAVAKDAELNKDRIHLGFSRAEFLQVAFYIENDLPWHVQRGKRYFTAAQTELPCELEYDSRTKKVFILLTNRPHTYVGHGSNKIISKVMLYDRKQPRIVARGLQTEKKKNEITVSRALRGAPGVFEILACTKYKHKGEKYRSIYSKLYKSGSLYSALHKKQFSLFEKAKMALTLIIGIDELHKRKFTHRDISTRNCLIEIPAGWPGRRDIKVGLADLGRSEHLSAHIDRSKKVQGHSMYTPPEGIYREDMRGQDYLRADVFAMGCVLYEIFYGHLPSWHREEYFKKHGGSEHKRYNGLVKEIKLATRDRRSQLWTKKWSGKISAVEEFEHLVLRMVHHNKLSRGTSGELRAEMERIFKKIKKIKN